jgi:hypothetical protein
MVLRGELDGPMVGAACSGGNRDRMIGRMHASLEEQGGVARASFDWLAEPRRGMSVKVPS